MNTRCIFLILLLFFNACQKEEYVSARDSIKEEKSIDMKYFYSLNIRQKADFINKLNNDLKGNFLKEFLPGSTFILPPNETIKFLKNGEIIILSVGHSHNDFQIAHWQVKNYKLNIWKTKEKLPFPKNNYEIWENLYCNVINGNKYNPSKIDFRFTLPDGSRRGFFYDNSKANEYGFKLYEQNLKLMDK